MMFARRACASRTLHRRPLHGRVENYLRGLDDNHRRHDYVPISLAWIDISTRLMGHGNLTRTRIGRHNKELEVPRQTYFSLKSITCARLLTPAGTSTSSERYR